MARTGRDGMRAGDDRMAAAGTAGAPLGGPSEAELQAMLVEMREAPVEQVLAEVMNVLFQTIQVKLGRKDARVLIDVAGAFAEATAGRIDAGLHGQVVQALAQLRLAQVEEEGRQGTAPASTEEPSGGRSAPPAGGGPASSDVTTGDGAGGPTGPAASRLWVPGR
jgi:hypothetical protein